MAVTVRGMCTGGNDGGSSTAALQTITLPANCVPGDILIATADANTGTATCSSTISAILAGPNTNTGSTERAYMFGKALTAADISGGTFTTTWSSAIINLTCGIVMAGGASIGIPAATVNSAATSPVTMPSKSSSTNISGFVQFVLTRGASGPGVATYPAGWTKAGTVATTSGTTTSNRNAQPGTLDSPGPAGSYGGESVSLSPSAMSVLYTVEIVAAVPPRPVQTVLGAALTRSGAW